MAQQPLCGGGGKGCYLWDGWSDCLPAWVQELQAGTGSVGSGLPAADTCLLNQAEKGKPVVHGNRMRPHQVLLPRLPACRGIFHLCLGEGLWGERPKSWIQVLYYPTFQNNDPGACLITGQVPSQGLRAMVITQLDVLPQKTL